MVEIFGRGLDSRRGGRKVHMRSLAKLDPHHDHWASLLAAALVRKWHDTCSFSVIGRRHLEAALSGDRPMLPTTWHFAFPAVIYFFRDLNGMLMVSRSRDGEWIARVLHHLGYRTARGSAGTGKGGASALRAMLKHLQRGFPAGLIADGSRGPARVAQEGILLVARLSGRPILPLSMAARPCWRFRSWDRTVLAKPFSRVVMAFGPPVGIHREASPEESEAKRVELENRLNDLTARAEADLETGKKTGTIRKPHLALSKGG